MVHDPRAKPDQGQAVPLVLGAVAVAAAFLVGLGAAGRRAHDAALARTAADAAALAGVMGGSGAAARLAEANGGVLVRFVDDGESVRVEVVVGSARAERGPPHWRTTTRLRDLGARNAAMPPGTVVPMAVPESPERPEPAGARGNDPGGPDADRVGAGVRAPVRPTSRKLTSERNLLTASGIGSTGGAQVGTDEHGADEPHNGRHDDGVAATSAVPVTELPDARTAEPDASPEPDHTQDRQVEVGLPVTAAVPVLPDLPFVGSPVVEEPVAPVPVVPGGGPEPAAAAVAVPVPVPVRTRRRRPRVRKVTRIVRYVDAWSVFKVALLVNTILGVVMLTASVLLWNLANTTDVVDNIEGVIADWFAYETFALDGQALFRAMQILCLLFVLAATGLAVLAAVLFNLISDLTGGVRFTVLEQEVVAQRPPVPGAPPASPATPAAPSTPKTIDRPPSRRRG